MVVQPGPACRMRICPQIDGSGVLSSNSDHRSLVLAVTGDISGRALVPYTYDKTDKFAVLYPFCSCGVNNQWREVVKAC